MVGSFIDVFAAFGKQLLRQSMDRVRAKQHLATAIKFQTTI